MHFNQVGSRIGGLDFAILLAESPHGSKAMARKCWWEFKRGFLREFKKGLILERVFSKDFWPVVERQRVLIRGGGGVIAGR